MHLTSSNAWETSSRCASIDRFKPKTSKKVDCQFSKAFPAPFSDAITFHLKPAKWFHQNKCLRLCAINGVIYRKNRQLERKSYNICNRFVIFDVFTYWHDFNHATYVLRISTIHSSYFSNSPASAFIFDLRDTFSVHIHSCRYTGTHGLFSSCHTSFHRIWRDRKQHVLFIEVDV